MTNMTKVQSIDTSLNVYIRKSNLVVPYYKRNSQFPSVYLRCLESANCSIKPQALCLR